MVLSHRLFLVKTFNIVCPISGTLNSKTNQGSKQTTLNMLITIPFFIIPPLSIFFEIKKFASFLGGDNRIHLIYHRGPRFLTIGSLNLIRKKVFITN